MVKKILKIVLAVLAVAAVLFLTLPQTYYMRRALIHYHPKIDQYPLFANRVVAANDPQPWPLASDYGRYEIDSSLLTRFEELGTVAYLVVRGDSLIFEQYWDGYGPASYSNSFSMAKSIVSMLVGIAIDEGRIASVDQPVADYLPQFGAYDGAEMTVRDLLTMSAGIEWDESYSGLFSVTTEAYYGRDLPGLISRVQQVERPGVRFNYQSGVTQILAMVLEKATGRTVSDYASEKLWSPIGAGHDALWSLDREGGTEKAYCCFNSNARDFARFGRLMLDRGQWKGRQVVSTGYMVQALTPAGWLADEEGTGPNTEYGYQFWMLERDGVQIPYMRGILGQGVFALPDRDAVVVRLGHKRSEVRTAQGYPDDIDTWLDAGYAILDGKPAPL